jgi:type II secretory pathway pseudopilin PulG
MDKLRAQRGMTLIEALVAIFVGVVALLGLYGLVDASNKLTKQQTEIADVQQSARIGVSELSRVIRQSRVGGLYYANAVLPIANNISGGTSLQDRLSGNPHFIRQGTDVIEVRGVILGDRYILDTNDVICSGPCATATQISVTIKTTAGMGNPPYVNFPSGVKPSLAERTRPFYFVVQIGENQTVTVGGSTYLVPVYVAGLVHADTSPSWYIWNTTTFSFTMNPQDAGARQLNATTTLPTSVAKSVAGGAIDVVRFFVDEGPNDETGSTADTHPSLAEATLDPSTGLYDIQPLIEEVEDFQIAYGVDGADGTTSDSGVSPVAIDLSGPNKDEWVGNVAGELDPLIASMNLANPKSVDAFIDTSVPTILESPQPAVPALRSVWISLVVKSTNPDFVYDGPGARGIKILDSAAVSFSAATGRPYRRRPLSLAVSLRNNALSNR